MERIVRCNKRDITGCLKEECDHYDWHEEDFACTEYLDCTLENDDVIKVKCVETINRWSKAEDKYMTKLANLSSFDGATYVRQKLSWKEIAILVNIKFDNGRTAKSCQSKYARG